VVGVLERRFLRLAQLALQRLFRRRAPELQAGVAPVPGPVVLDRIAFSLSEGLAQGHHKAQEACDLGLVCAQLCRWHFLPQGVVHFKEEGEGLADFLSRTEEQRRACAEEKL
jgi:hypothetical protein